MSRWWIQRGIAWILMAVLFLSLYPVSAWEIQEGEKCGSVYGEIYVGSDGRAYYSENTERYLLYQKDGTVSRHTMEAGYARQWFYMINQKGDMQKVFCIEAGVDFHESGAGYSASSGLDSQYGMRLPETARKGIAMTLLYGWQSGRTIPVSGINEDDYAVATQVLLWEFQQQLRIDTGSRRSNGWADADQYFKNIKGRPAEKAYDWILEQIASHMKIPGYTARTVSEAPLYVMEYDEEKQCYAVTVTDTEKTMADVEWKSDTNVQVERKGNKYTFSVRKPLSSVITLKMQKKTTYGGRGIFLWGMPGYQTMVSGAEDALYFYMRLRTEEDGALRIVKTSEDGKVSGVSFTVQGVDGQRTVKTDDQGVVLVENLKPGTYTIMEADYTQYKPQTSKTVKIRENETTEISFHNEMKRGNLKVIKTAEDGLVKDVKFRLYGTSLYGTKVDVTVRTNEKGVASFKDIPVSGKTSYRIEEVNTGIQYVVPDVQNAVIQWNQDTEVSFRNILKKFSLHVEKVDKQHGKAQGDAVLSGAQYGLYRHGELVDVYTTDAEGRFTTSAYPCGEGWILKELQPSEGYLLNPEEYPVGAEPGHYALELNDISLEVTEEVIKGQIQIIKHIDAQSEEDTGVIEQPEKDAVFAIYRKEAGSYENAAETERALLTTDACGFAKTEALPYGSYTVHQISGLEGHALVPDFTVHIDEEGKLYSYIINNQSLKSKIRIEKRDQETGNLIAMEGTGFQILDTEGSVVIQKLQYPTPMQIDTFYTNEEGWLMLPQELPYGSYQLVEVQAPEGYLKDTEPVDFAVGGDTAELVIVKENKALKGKIQIEKRGDVFATVVESKAMYQPVFETQPLAGAEFTITAAEDVYTNDGTLRAAENEIVAVISTDENGRAETDDLYLGKYRIEETKVPEGYLAQDPVLVEVTGEKEKPVTVHSVTIRNDLQRMHVHMKKQMETDEQYGKGNQGEIMSVRFGLYADEDIVAEDGTMIPKGKLIEIAGCNEEGDVDFKTALPYGKYVVRERTTHEAYQLDTVPRPFTFSFRSDWPVEVEMDMDPESPVYNMLKRGKIAGRKTDDTGRVVEGAVIGIFDTNETDFCEESALAVTQTGIHGVFKFTDVPFGSYIVREIEAPEGYVLNEESFVVKVEEEDEYEEVLMINKYITGSLILSKTDVSTGEPIPGCGIEIQDAEGNILLQDVTNEEGKVEFSLGYGDYFYREYDAPEGYLIDEKEYPFSIREDGQIIQAEMTNRMIEGLLVIEKLDGETGTPLERCGIEILDASGTILQRQYTDKRGLAMFDLLYGDYYYREFDAPDGYELDETARAFRIEEDECMLTREMENFKEKGEEVPQTGDSLKPLLPWLTGSAASAVLLLVLWKWRRRRQ